MVKHQLVTHILYVTLHAYCYSEYYREEMETLKENAKQMKLMNEQKESLAEVSYHKNSLHSHGAAI